MSRKLMPIFGATRWGAAAKRRRLLVTNTTPTRPLSTATLCTEGSRKLQPCVRDNSQTAGLQFRKPFSHSVVCATARRHHSTSASLFDEVCSETLNVLSESLEELPDFIPELPESFDVEYTGEVLTLHLTDGHTYVINRQAPNQQIWLSSPISGPKRYDFIDGDWIYSHDNSKMIDLLETELSELLNFEFELNDVRHCLLAFT